jgi:hypothetical protein
MAHFAKVNNSIVEQVLVAEQDFIDTYIDGSPGEWIQTSYNTRGGVHYSTTPIVKTDGSPTIYPADSGTPLRMNFAAIGDTYDVARDAFIAPQPYPSWTLVEATCKWAAPVTYPDDGKVYEWNEDTTNWVEVT